MFVLIDSFLLSFAKKMIGAAAFFGVSRRQLIYWYMITSSIVMFLGQLGDESPFADIFFSIIGGWGIARLLLLPPAMKCYREDGILSNDPDLRLRCIRIFGLVWFYAMSFGLLCPAVERIHCLPIIVTKILLPVYLWPWLMLNQNTGSKKTAKDMAKSLIAGLKKVATESLRPQPVPQPIPVSNCLITGPADL